MSIINTSVRYRMRATGVGNFCLEVGCIGGDFAPIRYGSMEELMPRLERLAAETLCRVYVADNGEAVVL